MHCSIAGRIHVTHHTPCAHRGTCLPCMHANPASDALRMGAQQVVPAGVEIIQGDMMSQEDVANAFSKAFSLGKASVFISSSNSPQQAEVESKVISAAQGYISSPQDGMVVKVSPCLRRTLLRRFLAILRAMRET